MYVWVCAIEGVSIACTVHISMSTAVTLELARLRGGLCGIESITHFGKTISEDKRSLETD